MVSGVATPHMHSPHLQYAVLLYCLVCKCIVMSMVVALSKQVVKPHSRQTVVKTEVLHMFEYLLLVQYSVERAIKMGVFFIKWVWLDTPTILKFLDPSLIPCSS